RAFNEFSAVWPFHKSNAVARGKVTARQIQTDYFRTGAWLCFCIKDLDFGVRRARFCSQATGRTILCRHRRGESWKQSVEFSRREPRPSVPCRMHRKPAFPPTK